MTHITIINNYYQVMHNLTHPFIHQQAQVGVSIVKRACHPIVFTLNIILYSVIYAYILIIIMTILYSVLSQIFLCDISYTMSVKYNPSRREFCSFILSKIPSIEFIPTALDRDKALAKFCETSKLRLSDTFDIRVVPCPFAVLMWIANVYFSTPEHFQLLSAVS